MQDLDLVETSGGATLTSLIGGVGINGNHSDFFFGDGDMEQLTFDYETFGNLQNVQVSDATRCDAMRCDATRWVLCVEYPGSCQVGDPVGRSLATTSRETTEHRQKICTCCTKLRVE